VLGETQTVTVAHMLNY